MKERFLKFKISKFGENACLVQYSYDSSAELTKHLTELSSFLRKELDDYIQDVNFSYNEMAVYFKYQLNDKGFYTDFERLISDFYLEENISEETVYEIPVCYSKKFGLDIEELCKSKNISAQELIKVHAQPIYPVRFIGFLPGFPYLSGLNKKLAFPRKKSPRRVVLEGSVGIANQQTGIYPIEISGGWNIIGRTPIKLFDAKNEKTLLTPGDFIKFSSISYEEYEKIESLVKKGEFQIKTYNA